MSGDSLDGRYDDFRHVISRDELVRAMELLAEDHELAQAIANELYSVDSESVGISGDVVSALSSLSADTAERVRLLLGETRLEADARLAEFRSRIPLRDPA